MSTQTDETTYPHDLAGEESDPPPPATEDEIAAGRSVDEQERAEGSGVLDVEPPESTGAFGGRQARPWRLARAIEQVRAEANAANPGRDKRSDGTIGDAAHAARSSDHNPWVVVGGTGVVRAVDLDADGLDLPTAFERLRAAARAGGLPQVVGGGYAILNRRITAPDFSGWRAYKGRNPHTSHGHISVGRSAAAFDSPAAWGIFGGGGTVHVNVTTGGELLRRGSRGPRVAALQTRLRTQYPLYAKDLQSDGVFGARTEAAVREFQRRAGLTVDGVAGPATLARLGL
jgi:Putative peptidoglycan binding domain